MRRIWIMDTALPSPDIKACHQTYNDVIEAKNIQCLDLSFTLAVRGWISDEIQKMDSALKVLDFETQQNNFIVTFFNDNHFGLPEAFYNSNLGILAIKISQVIENGRSSEFQQATIHEVGHLLGFDTTIVGLAYAEGFALWLENLFDRANGIPFEHERIDDGYKFSFDLLNSTIESIYHCDLREFCSKAKKGQEPLFINDLDSFLLQHNCNLNAEEFARITSLMFYAKKQYYKLFDEVTPDFRMESHRQKLLNIMRSEVKSSETIDIDCFKYYCQYVVLLFDRMKKLLGTQKFRTFSQTFDREMGNKVFEDNEDFFKKSIDNQKNDIINIFKKTCTICGITISDMEIEDINKLNK